MLITIFIFVLIGIAIINFNSNISFLNKVSNDNLIAQEDLRRALKTMSAEIRSMSTSDTGAYPILEASSSSLVFFSNIDTDELIERINYFLDGKNLKKGITKPTGNPPVYNLNTETIKILARDIISTSTPLFNYYDTNYDGFSEALSIPIDISLIRLIKINITVDAEENKLPGPFSLTTQVSIRNLKDNL